MKCRYVILFFVVLLYFACTPKVAEQVTDASSNIPAITDTIEIGPCSTFDQSPRKDDAENAHVIYRDYLRQGHFEEAFPLWQTAYELAPAADGKRNTHYADGIRFYEYFYAKETDPAQKKIQIDQIFKFYDQINECYGEVGYVAGRKAFDLYYKYKDRGSREEIFALFKQSIDVDGLDAQFFILNPFTDILVRMFGDDKVELAEAQKYANLISARLEKGLNSGENQAQWQIINEYVPKRLETFEGEKGFYDCDYFTQKYLPLFLSDTTNCESIDEVYGRLRWAGCPEMDANLARLDSARIQHCVVIIPPSNTKLAYEALRNGDYQEAILKFQVAVDSTDDNDRKATYLLLISKIYYSHLKNFSQARKYALEAANYRANWGEPYLLIGRLYASSGPLCGPGRGWDSQIVVWPAIDKWAYAKRIDPDAAAEANKWINTYSQYMPKKEDIFQRNLQEGASFRVGCWIRENTIIRTAK